METVAVLGALVIFILLIDAAAEWVGRLKWCPHGIRFLPKRVCLECQAEEDRLKEERAAAAAQLEQRKIIDQASKKLRAEEIKRLSESWLSNATVYSEMPPQQFEQAVAELFRRLGYSVEQTPISHDGGKDAIAHREGKKYLIECKRYAATQKVGRRDLQILFSAMHAEQADAGFCVTTGTFTRTAKDYAATNNINLYDQVRLPFLVNEAYPVSTDFSRAAVMCRECGSVISVPIEILPATANCVNGHEVTSNIVTADLRVLSEGEVPYCEKCGVPMRLVRWNGSEFWGCSSYPTCRVSKPLRPRI